MDACVCMVPRLPLDDVFIVILYSYKERFHVTPIENLFFSK